MLKLGCFEYVTLRIASFRNHLEATLRHDSVARRFEGASRTVMGSNLMRSVVAFGAWQQCFYDYCVSAFYDVDITVRRHGRRKPAMRIEHAGKWDTKSPGQKIRNRVDTWGVREQWRVACMVRRCGRVVRRIRNHATRV